MTDDEIIKALECCNRPANQTSCDDCPYQFSDEKCSSKLIIDTLDLINRQKVEIEQLEVRNAKLKKYFTIEFSYDDLEEIVERRLERILNDKVKTEAIREFAERLKTMICEVDHGNVDNLVKEMSETNV